MQIFQYITTWLKYNTWTTILPSASILTILSWTGNAVWQCYSQWAGSQPTLNTPTQVGFLSAGSVLFIGSHKGHRPQMLPIAISPCHDSLRYILLIQFQGLWCRIKYAGLSWANVCVLYNRELLDDCSIIQAQVKLSQLALQIGPILWHVSLIPGGWTSLSSETQHLVCILKWGQLVGF